MPLINPLATVADVSLVQNALYGAAGIAAYPAAAAAANDVSMAEVLRYIQESQIGTLTNTGGTATLGALIGDLANEPLYNRLYELERHFHNYERWFGLAITPSATHKADRIGKTESGGAEAPFQIDAGNDDWGAWVQLLGEDDTPAVAGNVKWDIHRLMIVDSERDTATYFVQVGFGASGVAALAANTYTEVVYRAIASGNEETPIELMTRRQANDTLCWARCFCIGQNTGTLDFYVGLHEYLV
jgi:hypothetical protein